MNSPFVRATRTHVLVLAVLGLGAAGSSGMEPPPETAGTNAAMTPEMTIQDWPEVSRAAARAMIAQYGEPVRCEEKSLVWGAHGRWARIVVTRDAPRKLFRRRGNDVVDESIPYFVPDDRLADLKRFDSRLSFDRGTGELTSRAQSETLNILALNLADEVVAGIRTPEQARDFSRATARLAESGKNSPYMSALLIPLRVPSDVPPHDPNAPQLGY